jgi:hypothetical protein
MWEEMFPNSIINTDFTQSKNLIVILGKLFIDEDPFTLETKLVQQYKIPIEVSKRVKFLVELSNFDTNLVYDYYKEKNASHTTKETILEFGNVLKDDNVIKFANYTPIVNVGDLIKSGFKKGDLGREIRRIETENFILS